MTNFLVISWLNLLHCLIEHPEGYQCPVWTLKISFATGKKINLQNHIPSREHDPKETHRVNRDREGNCLIYTPSLPSTGPVGQGTSAGWGQNSNFRCFQSYKTTSRTKAARKPYMQHFPVVQLNALCFLKKQVLHMQCYIFCLRRTWRKEEGKELNSLKSKTELSSWMLSTTALTALLSPWKDVQLLIWLQHLIL